MTSFKRLFTLVARQTIHIWQGLPSNSLWGASDFILQSQANKSCYTVAGGATAHVAFQVSPSHTSACASSQRLPARRGRGCHVPSIGGWDPLRRFRPQSNLVPSRPASSSSFLQPSSAWEGRALSSADANESQPTIEEAQMTCDARTIYQAAIDAVDPETAVRNRFQHLHGSTFRVFGGTNDDGSAAITYDVEHDFDEILVVGFGKASAAMAAAVVEVFAQASSPSVLSKLRAGLIVVKDNHITDSQAAVLSGQNIRVRQASHPVPDSRSVAASHELLKLVRTHASPRTLVVACISGGGSALFCAPHRQLTLEDLQETNSLLLQSGWSIHEMNVVRKRLEQGKGGKLAQAANPSHLLSLILSDVLGDPLDVIASGPTVPDTSTWTEAWELVQRLEQSSHQTSPWPPRVRELILQGHTGSLPVDDAPVSEDGLSFERGFVSLVGNTGVAVVAAATAAQSLGYHPIVLAAQLQGEAAAVAQVLVSMAQHCCHSTSPGEYSLVGDHFSPRVALIAGGETTVTLPPGCSGIGGRNQELALAAALALRSLRLRNVVVCSVGTDGTDGPTDAAGAVVDGGTVGRLPGNARDYLQSHDAYSYLKQSDSSGQSPLIKVCQHLKLILSHHRYSHDSVKLCRIDRSHWNQCCGRHSHPDSPRPPRRLT